MKRRIIHTDKERVGDWVARRVNRTIPWVGYEAIGMEIDGKLMAGVVYEGYVPNGRCSAHVAAEGRRWLNRDYLWACFDYPFNQLGCKVLVGLVDADNADALRFDIGLGFQELVRIPDGAGHCDLVILTMRREQCRWLDLRRKL